MPVPETYDFETDEPYLPARKKGFFEIFKSQPLIPLDSLKTYAIANPSFTYLINATGINIFEGLGTIIGSFVYGSYAGLVLRNQKMSQLMMRVRVYSQFFTLLVISYHYGIEMARGER